MTRKTDRNNLDLKNDHAMIGEVIKPHGILGEIKIYPYSEQPENFKNYREILLQNLAAGGTESYKIVKCRVQGRLALLQLEGVTSREAAESLSGSRIWLKKTDLPVLGTDEYYWHQLQGLLVVTESGQDLGRVSKLFSSMAHDVMVITGAGHEYMIPVKRDIIIRIDEQGGKIIISPPPGLLEMNQ
jgi:16S rRNA processing protein RimM